MYKYVILSLGDSFTWEEIWSYRRSIGMSSSTNVVLPGEISNQNWESGNDYGRAYLLLSEEATRAQASSLQGWTGGVNLTSSAGAESTAYGWVTYFYDAAPASIKDYLSFLSSEEDGAGTETGLSKMPYLRDTRRSVGLDGFRLFYANLTGEDNSSITGQEAASNTPPKRSIYASAEFFLFDPSISVSGLSIDIFLPPEWYCKHVHLYVLYVYLDIYLFACLAGVKFHDRVGIGDYLYADTHRLDPDVCTYPEYLSDSR